MNRAWVAIHRKNKGQGQRMGQGFRFDDFPLAWPEDSLENTDIDGAWHEFFGLGQSADRNN